MKKYVKVIVSISAIALLTVSTSCSGVNSETEIKQTVSEETVVTTLEKATEAPTDVPTTVPSETTNLRTGYWCYYSGGESMTAYTFSDEQLDNGKYVGHMNVYDVKNGSVTLMQAQDNNQMINYEIKGDTVLVTGEGGSVITMTFSDDSDELIESSNGKELHYVHFNSVPDYNKLQDIAPKQSAAEQSNTSKNSLESGLWVKYSPQAAIFETYKFSDGIIERKEYSFENGSIEEFNSDYTYAFMTYQEDEDSVTIRDDSSREWTYNYIADEDILERTYQDTIGTDTFTVTEKMYHHSSFPSYETVKEQSKK